MDFVMTMNFNSIELKSFDKFENGRLVHYSYSIERDRDGNEVSRTEPEAISSLGWSDGSPFTQSDLNEIKRNGENK
jgi:hypothetical protein